MAVARDAKSGDNPISSSTVKQSTDPFNSSHNRLVKWSYKHVGESCRENIKYDCVNGPQETRLSHDWCVLISMVLECILINCYPCM